MLVRLLLLFPLLALAACASTTEIQTRHQAPGDAVPVTHLLLVARTPEQDARRHWENECAETLGNKGLTLTRSHKVLPGWFEAGTDALEQWARDRGADAILLGELTRLVLSPPNLPREGAPGEPDMEAQWTLTLEDGKVKGAEQPAEARQEVDFQLIAPTGQRLWAGTARTHEANELTAIADSQCRALHKTLVSLGLLPG